MAKTKTAKTIPKSKKAAKPTPKAKAKPMTTHKPETHHETTKHETHAVQAAPKPQTFAAPKQQDAADILGVIAGTSDRGAHGVVGTDTAQRIIDTLTAAGYTIS